MDAVIMFLEKEYKSEEIDSFKIREATDEDRWFCGDKRHLVIETYKNGEHKGSTPSMSDYGQPMLVKMPLSEIFGEDDDYQDKYLESISHNDLVDIGERFLLNKGYSFALKELKTSVGEIPDVIGWKWGVTTLIECKTSRSDFINDMNKPFRADPKLGMGRFRFYLAPKGLISVDELPDNWGLISLNKRGGCIIEHNPYNSKGGNIWKGGFKERNVEGETIMLVSALRRLNISGDLSKIYNK